MICTKASRPISTANFSLHRWMTHRPYWTLGTHPTVTYTWRLSWPPFLFKGRLGYMASSLPLRRYVLICKYPAVGSNRAIEVAQKFPNAQVTGVDIHAMVPRFVLGGPRWSPGGHCLPDFSMPTIAQSHPTFSSSSSISWPNHCHGNRVLSTWSTSGSSLYMYVREHLPMPCPPFQMSS